MMDSIIGGEFEFLDNIPIVQKQELSRDYIMYSSGRAALFHILKYAQKEGRANHIYIPDYICDSVYHVCESLGIPFTFYPVDDSLKADVDSLNNIYVGGAILVVNYFGVTPCEDVICDIKRTHPETFVILDNVQAPFLIERDTHADVSFTSLRKALPVPDGGLVHLKGQKLIECEEPAKFSQYKIAASYLKNLRSCGYYDDDIYLDLYHKGEETIDTDYDKAPSQYTMKVYGSLDMNRMIILRKRNASVILKGLNQLGLKPCVPISEDDIPLFIPILLENRDKVRKAMFANNIFLPVHWPVEEHKDELKKGSFMANHELSIIIDHRYSVEDMESILDVLEKNLA